MIGLLVQFLIFCLLIFVMYFIANKLLPEPAKNVATVIIVVIACIVLLVWLANGGLTGLGLGMHSSPCLK